MCRCVSVYCLTVCSFWSHPCSSLLPYSFSSGYLNYFFFSLSMAQTVANFVIGKAFNEWGQGSWVFSEVRECQEWWDTKCRSVDWAKVLYFHFSDGKIFDYLNLYLRPWSSSCRYVSLADVSSVASLFGYEKAESCTSCTPPTHLPQRALIIGSQRQSLSEEQSLAPEWRDTHESTMMRCREPSCGVKGDWVSPISLKINC